MIAGDRVAIGVIAAMFRQEIAGTPPQRVAAPTRHLLAVPPTLFPLRIRPARIDLDPYGGYAVSDWCLGKSSSRARGVVKNPVGIWASQSRRPSETAHGVWTPSWVPLELPIEVISVPREARTLSPGRRRPLANALRLRSEVHRHLTCRRGQDR